MRNPKTWAALSVCAAVLCAFAILAGGDILPAHHVVNLGDLTIATPALVALRAKLTDINTRAAARIAEVHDDTPAEQVRQIENDHAALLREAGQVEAEIAAAERAAAAAPANDAAIIAAVDTALRAERGRIASINDIGARAHMGAADIATAVRDGVSVEDFRTRAFDNLATRSQQAPTDPANVTIGRDETVERRNAITDALVTRMANDGRRPGESVVAMPEHARPYANMRLVEIAATCINYRSNSRVWGVAEREEIMSRAMMTTSDFPAIFQDAINRRLLGRYQAAKPVYRLIAARYLAGDFRVGNVVRAGDFPTLQPVLESGEIKQGKFSESKETIQVAPYGVGFNLSRQMLVNDNLGAIDQVLSSYGDRVTDWENGQVMAKVVANPALLTDGVVVFHNTHGNLSGSGAAISVTSIGAGRAALAKQTSLDGLALDLEPAVLLTSPDKRTEAEQLLTAITPAQSSNAVPESMRRIAPVSSAKLTGNAWYLFADVNTAPCFMYALLEGFEGPRLTIEQKFGTQGIGVQLEHDFGCSAIDFRGGYKNTGA